MGEQSGDPQRRINYLRDVAVTAGGAEFVTGTNENNMRLDARPQAFLADDAYAAALDTLVPTCVDLVILTTDRRHVLLGKRQQEPQPDLWLIGGRMRTRERWAQTATRIMRSELGLTLDVGRLDPRPLGAYSLIWDSRAQEPKFDGCHTTSLPFIYWMEPGEVGQITPNAEYASVGLWPLGGLPPMGECHPALAEILTAAIETMG